MNDEKDEEDLPGIEEWGMNPSFMVIACDF
jgi:hypothetical protein